MRDLPRAEDFQIPYCGDKYWPSHTSCQAKEHRNVMQVSPHVLAGFDPDLTEMVHR
jgi:hypothetical protein